VGLDPRRLEVGGDKHNASTFVDRNGLLTARADRIIIRPYPAPVLGGTELHAYFRPERLSEYLFNIEAIHGGVYLGDGAYSHPQVPCGPSDVLEVADENAGGKVLILEDRGGVVRRRRVRTKLVEALELNDTATLGRAKLTPEQMEAIRRACVEREDLAKKVAWISLESVGEGYDIQSFEDTGDERCIEVKATIGTRMVFEMTDNEWTVAQKKADQYFIYRVTKVRKLPHVTVLRNPAKLEQQGKIQKTPTGWRVTVK
jgi:hypothetical protein